MKLFGQLIRTAVNVAKLPVEVARDVVDPNEGKSHTEKQLEKIKDEADER